MLALRVVATFSVLASLLLAPSALASGGGGGGGSAPAPASGTGCAKITSFSIGDRTNWGNGVLISTPYAITSSCPYLLSVDETYVDSATGAVAFQTSAPVYPGTTSASGTFMFPGAPFSTRYQVSVLVRNYMTFEPLATQTVSFTTRKPQQNTGG